MKRPAAATLVRRRGARILSNVVGFQRGLTQSLQSIGNPLVYICSREGLISIPRLAPN
jgi:hypothetical protein